MGVVRHRGARRPFSLCFVPIIRAYNCGMKPIIRVLVVFSRRARLPFLFRLIGGQVDQVALADAHEAPHACIGQVVELAVGELGELLADLLDPAAAQRGVHHAA